MNKTLLHIEGLFALTLIVYFYQQLGFSWLLFFILLLTPDLAALAYLKSVAFGATVYNLFHTYTVPGILLMYSLIAGNDFTLMISLIWLAHIGMDRLFGYGLKYPTTFQDTHFKRL